MSIKYHVDTKKYRISPQECYIRINGWAFDTDKREIGYYAELNGQKVDCVVKPIKRPDVLKKYSKYGIEEETGFYIRIDILQETKIEDFKLYLQTKEQRKCVLNLDLEKIEKIKDDSTILYCIDNIQIEKTKIIIQGWATSIQGLGAIKFRLEDAKGNRIKIKTQNMARADLVEARLVQSEDKNCGFRIEFNKNDQKEYVLLITDGIRKKAIRMNQEEILKKQKVREKVGFVRASLKYMKPHYAKKMAIYIKKYGVKNLKEYIIRTVNSAGKPYEEWFEENKPTQKELQKQRETVFEKHPLISIIVPTYKTPINYLQEMIDSVIDQTYSNWELCIADGSEGDVNVERELEKYHQQDSRIKYKILEKNLGIAGNTNGALELATGEYIGLFDHDDILAPNALFEVVSALQEIDYDIIYTDEDKITGDEKKHMDPNFKPDFSMDLFRSHNYITHFFVVKKEIMDKIGGFRSEYDGSQDYDLMFRCIENATQIKHIPMILYHWRVHMNSVAGDPASKMYAYEAGKRAIEDHLKRMNIDATVEHVGLWGMYHVKYAIHGEPKVSIIIPNKDHVKDLDKCIQSLYHVNAYKNFEVIIIENNSEEKATFDYYERLKVQHDNIKVVTWQDDFNYSAINNYGVRFAEGEYLLFLNNDTEMITEDAIIEMLGCCIREEVGAVGAKLLYADDTVQHAGVVIGFENYAGHVNTGIGRDDYGYMVRARINCNYSAVTAACMMTKKSLFEQVEGFDEQFVVACNDVDYCLKLRELGKSIVFNAFSEWYHYESKSRGYEDTDEKIKRFEGEVAKFQKKWSKVLEEGDPYYNKNFPVTRAPFTLG